MGTDLYTTSITSNQAIHTITHAWAGTANASASIELVDGVESRRNLLTNPGFETNLTGWSQYGGTASRDTTTSHSGVASYKMNTSSQYTAYVQSPKVSVLAGEAYTISWWFQIPADLPAQSQAQIAMYLGTTSVGTTNANVTPVQKATDWAQLSTTFVVPAGVDTLAIIPAYQMPSATAGVIYMDDFLVETGTAVQPYFDGSTPTSYTYGQTNPILVDGWTESITGQNVINRVLGGGYDVTLQQASLRSGSFELLYADDESARAAVAMHASPAVFTITDSLRPSINMTYVVDGQVTRALDDESRELWKVTVNYQEVDS